MKLKELFLKKTALRAPVTINKIWIWEIIAAGIFLLSFLVIDFLVYRNIVIQKSVPPGDISGAVYLRKTNLVEAAKKIKADQDFLENPQYPSIKNPF